MDDVIKELLEAKRNAKENPSEKCIDDNEHDFQFFSHADGRETYTDFYRCAKCKEVVKKVHKRTGLNKMWWS